MPWKKGDPRHPRRGNGAGWGGAAKGKGDGSGAGRPEGSKNGDSKQARARAALEDAAPLAVQTLINVAGNVDDQRAVAAAVAILNRVGLHEKSGLQVTGADDGPVRVKVEIVDAADHPPGS
jgi:hypothetical protein